MSGPDGYFDLDDAGHLDFSEDNNWDVGQGNASIAAIAEDSEITPAGSGGASAASTADSDVFTPRKQMSVWAESRDSCASE
jgi:hypothetical protein